MPAEPEPATISAIRAARHLLVFTGAGVSAESGIPTFRDDDGFWRRFPPEEFATWPAIMRKAVTQPSRLAEFIREVIAPIAAAKPNAAHDAIAAWQSQATVSVATQNIDRLHQDAGSDTVHEVHGSLFDRVDTAGHFETPISRETLQTAADRLGRVSNTLGLLRAVFPIVKPASVLPLRPNIVLFGDAMAEPDWTEAQQAAQTCDACLVVGTSAQVFPAAMLPGYVLDRGKPVLTVGLEEPSVGDWWEGRASEIVPKILWT